MTVDASADITTEYLRARSHADLLESADEHGDEYVEEFLADALPVVADFLANHEKELAELPSVTFDPNISGVNYDPYHREGEMLLFGGPRGILQCGFQFLSHRDYLSKPSLLTILSKGLLHAYNQALVTERFDRHGSAARLRGSSVRLYDEYKMLVPGVDEGITQMFSLYIEGDVTDKALREGYIDEWASWYRKGDEVDVELFGAVAYTISDRIETAEGSDRDRIVSGLEIQEPLVRDGELSVLREYLAVNA
jgi:hypothetical protein